MNQEEIDRWEQAWEESAKRDFERQIYAQCDAEDEERERRIYESRYGPEITR